MTFKQTQEAAYKVMQDILSTPKVEKQEVS